MHFGEQGLRGAALFAAIALALCGCSGDDAGGDGDGDGDACAEDNPFGNQCAGTGANGDSGRGGEAASGAGRGEGGTGALAGTGAGGDCATATASASRILPTIHLIVDGSCSMELELSSQEPYGTCDIDEPGPTTRWGGLRQALVGDPDGVVRRLQDVIRFGFYLYGTDPSCPLIGDTIAPDVGLGDEITAAFPLSPPGRNTPTGLALQEVVDGIQPDTNPDSEEGPQIILLATDGAPNSCNSSTIDFEPSLDAAQEARDKGLTMYVLSLAEASGEYGEHLQEMADIGLGQQNAPLYTPGNPAQLQSDLEALIGGAVGCDVRVNGEVNASRACEGEVLINGNPLVCGTDWELADASTLRLLGDACDRFKTDASAMITARWPCGVFRVD